MKKTLLMIMAAAAVLLTGCGGKKCHFVSQDGKSWTGPVASCDDKTRGKTGFELNTSGRYIKTVLAGNRPGLYWSIHEIELETGVPEAVIAKYRKIAEEIK